MKSILLSEGERMITKSLSLKDYVGDKVNFTIDKTKVKLPDKFYMPKSSNPCIGSEYECYGVVKALYIGREYNVFVQWFNGSSNTYRSTELITFSGKSDKLGPNKAFRFQRGGRIKPKEGSHSWWTKVEWKTKD